VTAAALAHLADAELFDLGAYPGARPGTGTLMGDLLTLTHEGLTLADRMEGHPHFFYRERVTVATSGDRVGAWIYWAPRKIVAGQPRIRGGDWLRRGKICE
jgi:gamma-glutamylcyclotransferase (GGCT)/AIG2-like uncharacterized protein YtfP